MWVVCEYTNIRSSHLHKLPAFYTMPLPQIIQTFEFKRLEDRENGLKNVCISITRKQTFEEAQTRAS